MGGKQSNPAANPAANGRTRAYSGSDLPSATSGSHDGSPGRPAAAGARSRGAPAASGAAGASGAAASTVPPLGARARSVGSSGGPAARPRSGISIPNSGGAYSSPESGGSSPEERSGARLVIGSLPAHLSPHLFGGKRRLHPKPSTEAQ
uniref:Uncharacterized protein n=1 Tax=Kryptolebias marmoratus TaxID=37003 RepID=A0A3Q3EL02_KRYMA